MADRKEIKPKLQNAKITVPAPEVDSTGVSHWYLDTTQKSTETSVTLKADTGYNFESDGSLDYQGSYNSLTEPIPASHTDTVTFKLPDLDWYDQYIPLVVTMSATTSTPPTPKPEPEPNPEPDTPTQPDTPKTPAPKTQLDKQLATLKSSLRIPLDIDDDDELIKSYLQSATEYLASALGDEHADRLNSQRAKVFVNSLAEILYQNRGETTMKSLPYALQALLNQLKY